MGSRAVLAMDFRFHDVGALLERSCVINYQSIKDIRLIPANLRDYCTESVFVDLLRSPGIDSQPGGPVWQPCLTYRPARLHRLTESIPRNRFLGSINVYKYGLRFWNFCFAAVNWFAGFLPAAAATLLWFNTSLRSNFSPKINLEKYFIENYSCRSVG